MRRIFISYRRGDTAAQAGRLADRLTAEFGPDSVFLDLEAITAGQHFPKAIESALAASDVALVLIGRDWKRRLVDDDSNPSDWVRLEVAAALRRDEVLVIPVLLEGAAMPAPEDLPEDLKPLTNRHAFPLSTLRWNTEIDDLLDIIRGAMRTAEPSPSAAPEQRRNLWRSALAVGAAVIIALAIVLAVRSGSDGGDHAPKIVTTHPTSVTTTTPIAKASSARTWQRYTPNSLAYTTKLPAPGWRTGKEREVNPGLWRTIVYGPKGAQVWLDYSAHHRAAFYAEGRTLVSHGPVGHTPFGTVERYVFRGGLPGCNHRLCVDYVIGHRVPGFGALVTAGSLDTANRAAWFIIKNLRPYSAEDAGS